MIQSPETVGNEMPMLTNHFHNGRPVLSKTLFVEGVRCPKLLWYRLHRAREVPGPDECQQHIFKEANEVGHLARKLYPAGRLIPLSGDLPGDSVQRTLRALDDRLPLFEASFSDGRCYVRVDILLPLDASAWEIVETKATNKVHDEHYWDVAVQAHVLRRCGLDVRRCSVLHLNPDYVRRGELALDALFVKENITEKVSELQAEVERKLPEMVALEGRIDVPDVKIGTHCGKGKSDECPLCEKCWRHLPDGNVCELSRAGEKRFRLLHRGIKAIADIPDDVKLTANQSVQREAARTGRARIDKAALREFVNKIEYPASFLDFESYAPAVPMYDETRPFLPVVFQFSLHVLHSLDTEPEHFSFLANSPTDPRPDFMRSLHGVLPETGSIVVFNSVFELSRLRENADLLPKYRAWVGDIEHRTVDLLVPFRRFVLYHPGQRGSCSVKRVLPAWTGRSYDDLPIQNGTAASLQYLRATFGNVDEAERRRIRADLLQYCHLDTFGLILILRALSKAIVEPSAD